MIRSTWVWCMATKTRCTRKLLHTGKLITIKIFTKRCVTVLYCMLHISMVIC